MAAYVSVVQRDPSYGGEGVVAGEWRGTLKDAPREWILLAENPAERTIAGLVAALAERHGANAFDLDTEVSVFVLKRKPVKRSRREV